MPYEQLKRPASSVLQAVGPTLQDAKGNDLYSSGRRSSSRLGSLEGSPQTC